jgi:hypothetical protein
MATLNEVMKDTAEAIREKTGKSELIAPVDFAEEIKSISAGGGDAPSGGSNVEYLDVSGVSSLVKTSVVQYAVYVKAFVEAYDANVVGMTLFALSVLENNPIGATSAVAIDFTAEVIMDIGGSLNRMKIADSVLQNGVTQADIDAIPRLTKEQFYDLNA